METALPIKFCGSALTGDETEVVCQSQTDVDLVPVARLRHVRSINLAGTDVDDLSPLAGLTTLEEVDLSGTPVFDISPLAGLAHLQSLQLKGTKVSDLEPLSELAHLKTIILNRTQVSDLKPLARLDRLQAIECSHSLVTDVQPLAALSNLTWLDISNTGVTDFAPLAQLVHLRVLRLNDTKASELKWAAGLVNLQTLVVSNTKVSDLRDLTGLVHLQDLQLNNTKVSSLRPLIPLVGLRNLELRSTNVTDLRPLTKLSGLASVSLVGTRVSRTQIDMLQKHNPSLRIQSPVFPVQPGLWHARASRIDAQSARYRTERSDSHYKIYDTETIDYYEGEHKIKSEEQTTGEYVKLRCVEYYSHTGTLFLKRCMYDGFYTFAKRNVANRYFLDCYFRETPTVNPLVAERVTVNGVVVAGGLCAMSCGGFGSTQDGSTTTVCWPEKED
jgi:hypothetical protein